MQDLHEVNEESLAEVQGENFESFINDSAIGDVKIG